MQWNSSLVPSPSVPTPAFNSQLWSEIKAGVERTGNEASGIVHVPRFYTKLAGYLHASIAHAYSNSCTCKYVFILR